MGAMKNYLLALLMAGDNQEEQDAIEWAIHSGWLTLTYNLEQDHESIRNQIGPLVEAYRRVVADCEATNAELYGA